MIFVNIPGGKTKRLKGKMGGDKTDRYRRDERRYTQECLSAAERKSLRRMGRFVENDLTVELDEVAAANGRETFVTDDGNNKVTLIYAMGRLVAAHVRPA